MIPDLAEHISLLAAPIYAAYLTDALGVHVNRDVPPELLGVLRQHAIEQAHALWLETLDYET